MISKTETVSDNELIAQFMGFVQSKSSLGNTWEHPERMGIYGGVGLKLKYDTSWDWLMPVVDTIEEIEEPHPSNNPEKGTVWPYQFEILSRSIVQIIDNRNDNAIVTINQDGLTRIQAVYKAVVEFIRWYNNSQSPDTIK